MRRYRLAITAAVGFALALAAVATGAPQDRLPKLPGLATLAQGAGSPGPVMFNHASHVKADAPTCTTCHPRHFRILQAGTTRDGKAITHDTMNKGVACGSCHGKTAFGFDDCTMCHRSQ